jgi:hypothetical protein
VKNFATFDIEAKDWTNFEILGFFDGKDYKEFFGIPHFIDTCLQRKYRGWKFYAHFAGRYDFLFLLQDLLEREGYRVNIIDTGARIVQIIVKRGKNAWYFQDSFALMQGSLDHLAKSFKVKYQKQQFDHDKEDHLSPKGRKYLRHDVFALYEIIDSYSRWGENDGKLRVTAASQALYIFRKHYLKQQLYKLPESTESFIRQTYYGGRTEIFKMYGENLNYYDVNSMYPYQMTKPMPTGKPARVKRFYPQHIGFYHISVSIPKDFLIPYIPFVHEGKLLFPTGNFQAFVTSAEIKELIKDKFQFKVLDGYIFKKSAPIFLEYVEKFYSLKQNAEKGSAESFIAKSALTNLYGKFGQQRDKEEIIKVEKYEDIIKEKLVPYFEEIGLYKKPKHSDSKFILPHLASYITSLSRMELYQVIKKCGFKNVHYTDTDSIVTTKKLPTSTELGGLKLEYKIKKAVFLQPKMYSMILSDGTELTKMKGFNNTKISFDKFRAVLDGKPISSISADISRMIGWRESLNKFGDIRPERIKQKKTLFSVYDKRIIKKDFSTIPHFIA